MSYGDRQTSLSSIILVYKLALALALRPKFLTLAMKPKSLALALYVGCIPCGLVNSTLLGEIAELIPLCKLAYSFHDDDNQ